MSRLLTMLLATLTLAACAAGDAEDPAPATRAGAGATPSFGTRHASQSEETPIGVVAITVTVAGGRSYPASLADNPTARDLAAQLPLTLTFSDYHGVEKVASLPGRLTTQGVPAGAEPEVNDIGYYAPFNNLVLYYGKVGYWDGIVRLGTVPAGMQEIAGLPDGFTVTLTRA